MYLSRRLDDREIQLKRQNKFISNLQRGHEAVTTVAGLLLRPGVDWIYPTTATVRSASPLALPRWKPSFKP